MIGFKPGVLSDLKPFLLVFKPSFFSFSILLQSSSDED